jgi:excisionase family DNA binding protein
MSEPLTAQEAADALGYHLHHVYRLLRSGTLEGRQFNRVWMVDRAEVERFKAKQGPGGRRPKSAPEQKNA